MKKILYKFYGHVFGDEFFFQVCIENFLSFCAKKKLGRGVLREGGLGTYFTLLCIKPNKYEINFE